MLWTSTFRPVSPVLIVFAPCYVILIAGPVWASVSAVSQTETGVAERDNANGMAKIFKIILETGPGYGLLRPGEVLVVDRCATRNTSRHLKLHEKADRMTPAFPKGFCTIERAD